MFTMFKSSSESPDFSSLKVTYEGGGVGLKEVLILSSLGGGRKRIFDQLNGYARGTLSARKVGDPRIQPGFGSYRHQLPDDFYVVSSTPSEEIRITGKHEVLKDAIEALIVGKICKAASFSQLSVDLYIHAQEIERKMPLKNSFI